MTTNGRSIFVSPHGSRALRRGALALCVVVCCALPGHVPGAFAQDGRALPIATLDEEALFLGSAFGQRVTRELEGDRNALATENRQIEAELIAEERALIAQRNALPAADFAPLAEAFDLKVQRIREEQDRKGRSLQSKVEEYRQQFLSEIGPVLTDLLGSIGAQVLLDRAAVLVAVGGIDITGAAIAAIDARLGDGANPVSPLPAPSQSPEPGDALPE